MSTAAKIYRISIAKRKGDKKTNIPEAELRDDFGIVGDCHAGSERQVSLLPLESFDKMHATDLIIAPGDFAENITTTGLSFDGITVGRRLRIGSTVELMVTQIGKRCHHGCYIRERVGDCIMPREGIFARVVSGGCIREGDSVIWGDVNV